jgi:DNA-binding NtrC family response regulator
MSTSTLQGTAITEDADGVKLVAHRQSIVVIRGPDRGLRRELRTSRVTIGSAEDNGLVLTDPTVSRRHAVIEPTRQGRYLVRDLGSTNGTRVNGVRVEVAELPPRARIRFGDTEVRFEPRRKWERVQPIEEPELAGMIGTSVAMRTVFAGLRRIAETDLACVLVGATGTGKDLAARALHAMSPRAAGPFVVVDCGALHAELAGAELFGYERGAFTGAERSQGGLFERANNGTVFLDEIGELPLAQQSMLLRTVQERTVRRLGANEPSEIDVRVVAATHRPLWDMVEAGTFREDLFHRLAEVVVALPSLEERPEDIPLLAAHFVAESSVQALGVSGIDQEALEWLSRQRWPGNIRQLRNVIRRAAIATDTDVIGDRDLRESVAFDASLRAEGPAEALRKVGSVLEGGGSLVEARERWAVPLEREFLVRLLDRTGGDLDVASKEAAMHKKSLVRLLRKHGIDAATR